MVKKEIFGKTKSGQEIYRYWLENEKGMRAGVINYGAILVNLFVPDKEGKVKDVVLGYDTLEPYFENGGFFGATVGPNANRVGGAAFTVDGQLCRLDKNDGENNLHSHKELGYHKRIWSASEKEDGVTFFLEDEDGSMGFPGNKKVWVTYILTQENELKIKYEAESDKNTVINMTNHTYFNLAGQGSGSVCDHILTLKAGAYTPVVSGAIPTGEVIDGADGTLREFAVVEEPVSGREMRAYTDLPGVQFYAGNGVEKQAGKEGAEYGPRGGLCLETQYFPDTPNKPEFPSAIFGPERKYESMTVYRFGLCK